MENEKNYLVWFLGTFIAVVIFGVLIFLGAVYGEKEKAAPSVSSSSSPAETTSISTSSIVPAEEVNTDESEAADAQAEAEAEADLPQVDKAEEAKLKTVINNTLEANYATLSSLDIDVNANDNNNLIISIGFNVKNEMATLDTMNSIMSNLYYALFKKFPNIGYVNLYGSTPLMDRYGNLSDKEIYATLLNGGEAYKINWNNSSVLIKDGIIPSLWTLIHKNPALE